MILRIMAVGIIVALFIMATACGGATDEKCKDAVLKTLTGGPDEPQSAENYFMDNCYWDEFGNPVAR